MSQHHGHADVTPVLESAVPVTDRARDPAGVHDSDLTQSRACRPERAAGKLVLEGFLVIDTGAHVTQSRGSARTPRSAVTSDRRP